MADEAEEQAPVEGTEGVEPEATDTGGGNPAWDSVRSKLDPATFNLIENDLKGWDSGVQKRIESVKGQYKWADDLTKGGYTPEQVQQALNVTQALDTQPEEIYKALGDFLQKNGRMPNEQELSDEVEDNQGDEDESSTGKPDPRLDQLAEQQEQMREFLQQQEQERLQREASDNLNVEIEDLKKAHPEFEDADIKEILDRAAWKAHNSMQEGKNEIPSLEDVAKDYTENVRNRILSAQRPGDTAPKLPPVNGGVASNQNNQKSLGSLSNSETQNLIVEVLKQANG